jgi:hypothetical protein
VYVVIVLQPKVRAKRENLKETETISKALRQEENFTPAGPKHCFGAVGSQAAKVRNST